MNRATTCKWSWRTTLPSAPTLILSAFACAFEEARRQSRLCDEKRTVGRLEVRQFDEVFAPRGENEPRPAGVVHQEHAAKTEIAYE